MNVPFGSKADILRGEHGKGPRFVPESGTFIIAVEYGWSVDSKKGPLCVAFTAIPLRSAEIGDQPFVSVRRLA